MGPGDHHVHAGQGVICTAKARDKHDRIIVQEKLDGSCVAVVLLDGQLHAIGRAGWPAQSSKYEMHQLFAAWVRENDERFRDVLREGERIVGEWLAQAHSTIYTLPHGEPFAPFDIMRDDKRIPFDQFCQRASGRFYFPGLLHDGGPISTDAAMELHGRHGSDLWPCDGPEGVVYRVERHGEVDFLAKYVRPDKIDGKYLNGPPIWNWRPSAVGVRGAEE